MNSPADYFSANASEYERYRPTYPDELGAFLAGLPAQRALALDCGCGSGQLTALLAEHFQSVVGTDVSAEQIERARRHRRIVYRLAGAESSGLADASVDLVTAAQAAHWFDLPGFYAEAYRVLKPTGAIALVSYGVLQIDHPCDALVSDLHFRVLAPYWPPERREVDGGYKRLPFPMLEEPSPALFMRARWTTAELIGYLSTWSAIRVAERHGNQHAVHEALNAIRGAVGSPEQRLDVRWPLNMRVGRPTRAP